MLFFYANLGLAAFNFLVCILMASLTPKNLVFGVKLPPDQIRSVEARAVKRNYRLQCLYFFLASLAVSFLPRLLFLQPFVSDLLVLLVLLLAMVFIILFPYARAHRAMLALKKEKGWDTPPAQPITLDPQSLPQKKDKKLPGVLPAVSLVMMLPTFGFLFIYQAMNTVPYLMAPGAEMLVTLIAVIVQRTLNEAPPVNIHPDAEINAQLNKRNKRTWSMYSAYAFFIVNALITALVYFPLAGQKSALVWVVLGTSILLLLPAFVLKKHNGSGGSRLKPFPLPTDEPKVIYRDMDENWKFGLLYCNPDDPAGFVESRGGVNMEMNIGHRKGKLALVVLAIVYLALLAFGFQLGLIKASHPSALSTQQQIVSIENTQR